MKHLPLRLFALLFFVPLLLAIPTYGQLGPVTPNAVMDTVFDRLGNKHHLLDIAVNDTVRGYDTLIINKTCNCDAGYFKLFFEPGSGMEDTTVATDTLRRNTLCRVFKDLSQFIQSPLRTNGKKMNIWVRNPSSVTMLSGIDGYGTSFYHVPSIASVSGISDNITWITLHSGTDGYTNVVNPAISLSATTVATFFHAMIAFDFSTYTWHTDLTNSPSSGDYDLYTVALREAAHMLGVSSAINDDGSSILGSGFSYYSRYDKFLKSHSGIPLLTNTGSISLYNYAFNTSGLSTPANVMSPNLSSCVTDSTDCDTAIQYDGSVTLPVYTPNCYELGFSMSNFEDQCTGTPNPANNNLYFAVSNVTFTGSLKRYLKPEERSVLCDIGYTVDTVYGDTTNLNYYHYGSSICNGITVAGINDGYVDGAYTYTSSIGGNIQINGTGLPSGVVGILDNDVNANSFEGLEVLTGSGTLNTTSGISNTVVTYTPASGEYGPILLRYVPYNSVTGQRGNVTYISSLISHESECSDTSCQLVFNGNFKETDYCGVIGGDGLKNSTHIPAHICNWQLYANTPELYSDECPGLMIYYPTISTWHPTIPWGEGGSPDIYYPGYPTFEGKFVGMYGGRWGYCPATGPWVTEALKTHLAAPLVPGAKYILEFDGRVVVNPPDGSPNSYHDVAIQFYVKTGDPATITASPLCTTASTPLYPATIFGVSFPLLVGTATGGFVIDADTPNTWQHIYQEFTYTGPASTGSAQWLVMMSQPQLTAVHNGIDTTSVYFLDYVLATNVSIRPVIQKYPDDSTCPGIPVTLHPDSVIMDPTFVGGVFPPDVFTWTPSTGLSCNPCPHPVATLYGPVTYIVTESYYQCSDTISIFVSPLSAIAYVNSPCVGDNISLVGSLSTGTATPLSYSWSGPGGFSSTMANPTPFTATTAGVFIYTLVVTDTFGCFMTATATTTVTPTPAVIMGVYTVCVGATTTLTNSVGGGSWSSGNPSVATVGSSTGVVTGISAGTAIITYGFGLCITTVTVTVYPMPAAITGILSICVGATTALDCLPTGGTWTSTTPAVGTISTGGIVTGVANGTTTISYTMTGGCASTKVVTVHPVPVISPAVACTGISLTITPTPSIPGGTWESSTPAVGTISASGVFAPLMTGTTIVTYTTPAGCVDTALITVYLSPPGISGALEICEGETTALTCTPPDGGTWSSSSSTIASVGTDGVVTGVNDGTATITYMVAGGCHSIAVVTVDPVPDITGDSLLCTGDIEPYISAYSGGTWSSSTPSVATIGSSDGIVTAISPGTTIITYILPTGCYNTEDLTVNLTPTPIFGPSELCEGSTLTIFDTTEGGTWDWSPIGVLTVSATGVVTGLTGGVATVSYVMPTGCYVTTSITVNPLPDAISGIFVLCAGDPPPTYSSSPGGTWSSTTPSVATVGLTTGVVTPLSPGTTTISYILPTGCFVTQVITVNETPPTITGTLNVCVGLTTTLDNTLPGGTWSSSAPPIATIGSSSGIVTGIAAGTAIITYLMSTGCKATAVVTVNALPIMGGDFEICVLDVTTLTIDITGGTWTSSVPVVASIGSSTGEVTGVSAGTSAITYTTPAGCIAIKIMTVNPIPSPIIGDLSICWESSTIVTDTTPGGVWYVDGILTVPTDDSILISGATVGMVVVSYVFPATGCGVSAVVVIDPLPVPTSGTWILCGPGATTTFTATPAGGVWTSSVPSVATIDAATGAVATLTTGITAITYMLPTGCYFTNLLHVNPPPEPLDPVILCVGEEIDLVSLPSGGTWSSSTPTVAEITSWVGVLEGVSVGTTTITYFLYGTGGSYTPGLSCFATTTATVITVPSVLPITGFSTLCIGASDILFDATLGGSWTSSNPSVAPLVISTPPVAGGTLVAGMSIGTALISYTVINDCGPTTVTHLVTVIDTPDVTITGILGVCSDSTTTLIGFPAGGTWSSGTPLIATVGSATGVVTGIVGGDAVIAYTVTHPCGTTTVTTNVVVNMAPYITANFLVACQTLTSPADDLPNPVISDETDCILTCDSSIVRYYGHGVAGSVFTWDIAGGTVIADWGDSIDVLWTTVGLIGSITLHDSFHHCIDSARACIQVIDKPDAYFTAPGFHFCLGANVIFTDYSTGDPFSPIVYWHWNFGDGTGSSASGSSEHIYASSGTYTATLTVRNACNCTDSFKVVVDIDDYSGPDIYCPSIVCDSSYYTYSTSAVCDTFIWTVTGGTIVAGIGTSSIRVKWDMADSSGFGYVSLYTPSCGECDAPTTVKVPIILQSPEIAGPDSICTDRQYEYSFPLWPATDYMWGVLGSPDAIFGCHGDHKVVVNFSTPGTYTLHGWYQNRITLCGGNIFKTITVLPPASVAGITTMCTGATQTYTLSGSYSGDWNLVDYANTGVATASGSSTFTHTFSDPGVYVLYASGGFCVEPLTITVLPIPNAIDSVSGDDSVCLGRFYTYKGLFDEPGFIYQWEAIGGTVAPATGNVVTAQWTSTGTKRLKVRRVSVTPPYCPGPQLQINIMEEQITPNVTGEIYPCANTLHDYSANYNRGEVYDWRIIPNTAGSVVTGNHSADMQILWNHTAVAVTASVVATVRKCDIEVLDTLVVYVTGAPAMTVSVDEDTVCPKTTVTFTATAGAHGYNWNFGDGSGDNTTDNTTTHTYTLNATSSPVTYNVTVESDYAPGFCNPSGIGTVDVTVLPGPSLWLFGLDSLSPNPCDTLVVRAIVSNNVTLASWDWDGDHAEANDTTYVIYTNEVVQLTVTATNGCSITDSIRRPHCSDYEGCDTPVFYSAIANCTTVTLDAATSLSGYWATPTYAPGLPAPVPVSPPATDPATVTFSRAGVYYYDYVSGVCTVEETKVTVYAVPEFGWGFKCGTGGSDTVFLYNSTSSLPGFSYTSTWYQLVGMTYSVIPTTSTPYIVVTSGTSKVIRLHISGTTPDGPLECNVEHTITVPSALTVDFSIDTTPLCAQVPMLFTPLITGAPIWFHWTFGDGSSLLLSNAQREYTYGGAGFPAFQLQDVTLRVRDNKGCIDSATRTVEIHENVLRGRILGDTIACSSSVPVTLTYDPIAGLPIVLYEWSTGITEFTGSTGVTHSGAYWVTVYDAHQCQATMPLPPAKNVRVIETPTPIIHGSHNYCINDDIKLNGYAGEDVEYQWYRDGSAIPGATNSSITESTLWPGTGIGTHTYQLYVRIFDTATGWHCDDISALETINVYGLPTPPTITGPEILDCGLYYLQLTASADVPGTFNWIGAPIPGPVYNIDRGGPFRVWFTDLHGCVSHENIYVPLAPSTFMPYFPKGCYSLCENQLPLWLNGPPCVAFDRWAWLKDYAVVDSSTSTVPTPMDPYAITGSGIYQWMLDNGLCEDTSDVMEVEVIECNECQGLDLTASLVCDTTDPASYIITVGFNSYYSGTHYVLGTDIGPITPFSGIIYTTGTFTTAPPLTFTTFLPTSLPDSVTVMLALTLPDGDKCYSEVRVPLDTCYWTAERGTARNLAYNGGVKQVPNFEMNSSLLVFPNPASGEITISYDYGNQGSKSRQLSVYDVMGRKMTQTFPEKNRGKWKVDSNAWAGGMYIIRMEGDGTPLQTARVIITH